MTLFLLEAKSAATEENWWYGFVLMGLCDKYVPNILNLAT